MIQNYIKNIIEDSSTGRITVSNKIIKYKFEKYEITVELDEFQKFVGVIEVKINKNFLESHHKKTSKYDISQYYED
ncbi:MAG: hypothetical protein WCG23_09175 [bacterium]